MNIDSLSEEDKIQAALTEASRTKKPNYKYLQRAYQIESYHKLVRRSKGTLSKHHISPVNRKLNEEQNQLLCAYIHRLDGLGLGATEAQIKHAANHILQMGHRDKGTPAPMVGQSWTHRWISSNKEIMRVKQRAMESARLAAHSKESLEQYFALLKRTIEVHGIQVSTVVFLARTSCPDL